MAYIFREYEARQARKRELGGLLRLLGVEIQYNETMLEHFAKNPHDIIKDSDDLQSLADYFMNVAIFETERLAGRASQTELERHIPFVLARASDAEKVLVKVLGARVEPQVEVPALEVPRENS